MGNPKRIRKKYNSPKRPWNKSRILSERNLLKKYGLASKKELRIMDALIAKKRTAIKRLLAEQPEIAAKGKENIINSLNRIGLLSQDASMSDVLALSVIDILERRLQTLVFRQGLAKTIKQARQFILHGFISVNGRRVTVPSYIIKKDEENTIDYFEGKKPKVLEVELKPLKNQSQAEEMKKEAEKKDSEVAVSTDEKKPETKSVNKAVEKTDEKATEKVVDVK